MPRHVGQRACHAIQLIGQKRLGEMYIGQSVGVHPVDQRFKQRHGVFIDGHAVHPVHHRVQADADPVQRQFLRHGVKVSNNRRPRFSCEPPYSSVRVLEQRAKNWWNR